MRSMSRDSSAKRDTAVEVRLPVEVCSVEGDVSELRRQNGGKLQP